VPTEIERLYREHRAGLVRLVERELHDHEDAEDVVQSAFLDAQCALERGTIPRHPRAWLAAIAFNTAHRLRRRRLNAEPLEEHAVQEASGMSEIRAALASLPKEQRAAVVYRDVLGLSYGETAEQMGTSVNAVTMLLHRGRQRLRQTLGVSVGGLGLARWLKKAGMPQVAVVKGAAAAVVSAGLATAGVVVARGIAPIGTDGTAAPATRPGSLTARAGRTPGRAVVPIDSARRHFRTAGGSGVGAAPTSTQGSRGDASVLRLPTVPLPSVQIPTLPPTVAATVTVSTPIATATVATPTGTTATMTTPLTTVTVPIP
jgi:RNA polymerase sigma-70 factor (ECF subfamily)